MAMKSISSDMKRRLRPALFLLAPFLLPAVLPVWAHTSVADEEALTLTSSLIEVSLGFLIIALLLMRHYRRRKERVLTDQTQLLGAMIESLPDIVAYKGRSTDQRYLRRACLSSPLQ